MQVSSSRLMCRNVWADERKGGAEDSGDDKPPIEKTYAKKV